MTDQEAFDKVCEWLRRPGASRCVDENDCCVYYRPSDGNRCGIGGIMPEDMAQMCGGVNLNASQMADPEWIIRTGLDYNVNSHSIVEYFKGVNLRLLDSLQSVHDSVMHWDELGSKFNKDGENALAELAGSYHLNYTEAA